MLIIKKYNRVWLLLYSLGFVSALWSCSGLPKLQSPYTKMGPQHCFHLDAEFIVVHILNEASWSCKILPKIPLIYLTVCMSRHLLLTFI